MANKIIIAELDIDVNSILKATAALKKNIQDLKDAQKVLEITGKGNSEQFVQNASDLKLLTTAYNQNIKAIGEQTQASKDETEQAEILNAVLQQEVTTIAEAREQNKLLNKLRNETNVTTAEGIEQLNALNSKLDSNNEFVKENADGYLKQKINIGNYKDSIKEALGELNLMNGGIGGFIERSKEAGGAGNLLKSSLGGAASGMMGMVKASLAFIATPVGAILAVLVLAFALVKNAMNRSEEATNKITKIFTIFSAIVGKLLSFLEPLGDFLIDGIVMGFELAGKAAEAALDIISGGLSLLGFNEASKSVSGFKEEMKDASIQAGKLADAEAELEKSQRKSRLTQLEYQKTAEKFRQIRDDESKSIAERIKANNDLGLVLKNQLKDELAIAQQALIVANLRIQAEGKTKESLDRQAEALTQISDIQERITGQESEQIVNRVALQKEANEKAKELRDKRTEQEINASRQRIDLFVAEQGFFKKSTEEQYLFNKEILSKELKDLDLRYKKGKVSKLEYETEKLNLSNEFLKSNADLLIADSETELERLRTKNDSILEIDTFLNDELLKQKKDSIDAIAKAENEALLLKKTNGVINQQEFDAAIALVKVESDKKKDDLDVEREQADKDKKAVDLANRRENENITFEEDVQLQIAQNAIKLQQELLDAEKSGADKKIIKDKYAEFDKKLSESVESKKRTDAAQTFGNLATLFGEASIIGKAFALTQATITGYEAVLNAYSTAQKSPITLLNPAYPLIQAGISGAFSAVQIAKIAGAKFEKGGIQEVGGNRHSQGGTVFTGSDGTTFEAEKGEGIGILNRNAYSSFMDFNNRFGSGSSSSGFFQGGGIITQGVRQQTIDLNSVVDAISSMPAPQVSVSEIASVGNQFQKVILNADL